MKNKIKNFVSWEITILLILVIATVSFIIDSFRCTI